MDKIQFAKDGKIKLPQPDEIIQKHRDDAMGAYLMMFAAWAIGLPLPFMGLIASFIYYLINIKESRFVAFHAYQSLISHAFVSICNAILVIWTIVNAIAYSAHKEANPFNVFFFSFLIFVILANLIYTIISIIACVKAYKGKFYYILFFGRVSFNKFYGKKALEKQQNEKKETNLPPQGF